MIENMEKQTLVLELKKKFFNANSNGDAAIVFAILPLVLLGFVVATPFFIVGVVIKILSKAFSFVL